MLDGDPAGASVWAEFFRVVATGVVAGLSAAAVAILAPWAKWGVEKRQAQLENRQKLIAAVRAKLADRDFDWLIFRDDPLYTQLLPHLSDATRKLFASDGVTVVMEGRGKGTEHYRVSILDAVTSLEKKWKLI